MPGKVQHAPSREGGSEEEAIVAEGVYCNTRMTRSLSLMIGATVNLRTGDGLEFEGIIEAISPKLDVMLRMAHLTEHGNGSGVLKEREVCVKKENVTDMLMFGINDITEIALITEYDPSESAKGWEPDEMFRRNEELTGQATSYNEEMTQYSNVLVPDDDGTSEMRAARIRAEALAREIECNPASRKNIELENEDEEVDLDGGNRRQRPIPTDNSNWRSGVPGPQGAGRPFGPPRGMRGGRGGRGGPRGAYSGPPPQHPGQNASYGHGPRVINRSQPPGPPPQDANVSGNYGQQMRPPMQQQQRYQGEASPPGKDDGGGWETANRRGGSRRGGPTGRGGPPADAARLRQWGQDFKLAGGSDARQFEERKTPPPRQGQRQQPRYNQQPPLTSPHQTQDIRLQQGEEGGVVPSESMDSSPGITAKMQVDQRKKTPDQPSRKNSDAGSVSSTMSGKPGSKLNPDAPVFTPKFGGITSPPSTPLLSGGQSPAQQPQPQHLMHQQPLIPGGPQQMQMQGQGPPMGYPPPSPSPAGHQMGQYHQQQQQPASLMSASTPQSQVAYTTAYPVPPPANPNLMMQQQQYSQQQSQQNNNNNNNNRQRKGPPANMMGQGGVQTSLVGPPIVAGSAGQGQHPQYLSQYVQIPGGIQPAGGGYQQPQMVYMMPQGARMAAPGQFMMMDASQMAVSGPSGSYSTAVSSSMPQLQQPPPSSSQPPTPGPNPSPHLSQPPPQPYPGYPPPHQPTLHTTFNPAGVPTVMTSNGIVIMQPYGNPGAYASFPQQQMQMDAHHHQAQMVFAQQQQHLQQQQQQHPGPPQLVMSMAGPMMGPPVAGQVVPSQMSLPSPAFRRPPFRNHPPPRPASVNSLPPS